jgi:hypothetical protein
MGKPLDGRIVEYCWPKKLLFQINNPVEGGYTHNVIVHYDLQNDTGQSLAEYQRKINVAATADLVDMDQVINFLKNDANLNKIRAEIKDVKILTTGNDPDGN